MDLNGLKKCRKFFKKKTSFKMILSENDREKQNTAGPCTTNKVKLHVQLNYFMFLIS